MTSGCILFIPVSSTTGIGEYMRSLVIAEALFQQNNELDIHFILNYQVSYINQCPFKVHPCNGSATKDSKTVSKLINTLKPDLVIFDASGRGDQFKLANEVGSKVAFISQHNKKRNRGLKLNRLAYIDVHWVVQPDFCMNSLSLLSKLKLRLLDKDLPKNIGPVFTLPISKRLGESKISKLNLSSQTYVVFNAGSGGHIVGEQLAADVFYQAAQSFFQQSKLKCVVVFGNNYPKTIPTDDNIICLGSIDNQEFIELLIYAHTCVLSAGDTLLQAIALHKPCVSIAVSSDQPHRLKQCVAKGLVLQAQFTSQSLCQQAMLLVELNNQITVNRENLIKNMKNLSPNKALDIILTDIAYLLNDRANLKSKDIKKNNRESEK